VALQVERGKQAGLAVPNYRRLLSRAAAQAVGMLVSGKGTELRVHAGAARRATDCGNVRNAARFAFEEKPVKVEIILRDDSLGPRGTGGRGETKEPKTDSGERSARRTAAILYR